MRTEFFKYQALGNDMIVIDPANFDIPLSSNTIRLICDRHFGIGADGICYGPLSNQEYPLQMRFFNPDGSEAEKSGNGLRIFARYLWDQGYVSTHHFKIRINDERVNATIKDKAARTISMSIGRLSFFSQDIPVIGPPREIIEEIMNIGAVAYQITAVSIGNPHCVIFTDQLSATRVKKIGALIEADPIFPNRTNVQLVQIIDRHTLQIEIWERGAGYTLASGSSASATAGAALKTGRCDSPIQVHMPGGIATVAIDKAWQVTLTGDVEAICWGNCAPDFISKLTNS